MSEPSKPPLQGNKDRANRDPAAALDSIGVTRAHYVILVLVLLGGFFDVFEQDAIGTVGPTLHVAFGWSASTIGVLSTATFGAMVVGGVSGGLLADIAGRRILFTFNLGIYAFGAIICALAPDFWVLFIGRLVVGVGLGGELTIALVLLAELTPTSFRASAVSLFNVGSGGLGNPAAFGFGVVVLGVLGPFFGGSHGSWRWFFGLLILPALLVLFYRRYLPETPRYLLLRGRVDEANRTLSILASGRLNPKGLHVRSYLSPDAKLASSRSRVPLAEVFHGQLLRSTITVGVSSWMTFGAQIVVLTLMPTILVARGYSITSSLVFTMVMNLGSLLGAVAAAYLNSRVPRRVVVFIGAVLAFLSALAFGFLANGVGLILALGALFQFFVLLLNTTVWTWGPELYPTRVRAFGCGIVTNLGLAAGAVMPTIAGIIFDGSGIVGIFVLIAGMYVVMAVLALLAPETHGRSLEELHGEVGQAGGPLLAPGVVGGRAVQDAP